MITPAECKRRAAECAAMAAQAPNTRLHSILTDISRTWVRLSMEVEQSTQASGSLLPPVELSPPEPPREDR
jgi:hypothetical protein